jgi:hypothetical protein
VPTETAPLYERDFYAWTRAQARALRSLRATRPNLPLDLEHLAEEIRDLGSEQFWAILGHLEVALEHLLKLAVSPAETPRRQWMLSVDRARGAVVERMSASLERRVARAFDRAWVRARRRAELALLDQGEAEAAARLPDRCPWTLGQILDETFWPTVEPPGR